MKNFVQINVPADALDAARKELADFSPGYDAHLDLLSDEYDHEESVNELLTVLRNLLEGVR